VEIANMQEGSAKVSASEIKFVEDEIRSLY
jgi:hypothetical protein